MWRTLPFWPTRNNFSTKTTVAEGEERKSGKWVGDQSSSETIRKGWAPQMTPANTTTTSVLHSNTAPSSLPLPVPLIKQTHLKRTQSTLSCSHYDNDYQRIILVILWLLCCASTWPWKAVPASYNIDLCAQRIVDADGIHKFIKFNET